MEALAVFGIACNVIQVISFTRETILLCKTIYTSGVPIDKDGYTSKVVSDYTRICHDLQRKINDKGSGAGSSAEEKELFSIARDCLRAAEKLKSAADKLVSPSLKGHAVRSIYAGVSAKFKAGRLQNLEDTLKKHQSRLESHLLLKICKTTDATAIQQSKDFAVLDTTLQTFINDIAAGCQRLETLLISQGTLINAHTSMAVAVEAKDIKRHITEELSQAYETLAVRIIEKSQAAQNYDSNITDTSYARLIKSLYNSGLQERRTQIEVAHRGTFEWIYDSEKWKPPPGKETLKSKPTHSPPSDHTCGLASTAQFDCFACWLARPPGTAYWISGKSGSGKSTLTKFLASHAKTKQHLEATHGPTLILSHFIWLSGHPIQRSLKGILLSLVSQFLHQNQIQESPRDTAKAPEESLWLRKAAKLVMETIPGTTYKESETDWSYEELQDALSALLNTSPVTVCIILDGLDEADTDMRAVESKSVLVLTDWLCRFPRVKVCISSRPEPAFRFSFNGHPQLELQHLTRDDIRAFVVDNFESKLALEYGQDEGDGLQMKKLTDKICYHSDGVFLWVRLVTRSLLLGKRNGDTLAQMHERLDLLPRDLYELYQSMWQRLDEDDQKIYQREAALYINLALEVFKHSVVTSLNAVQLCVAGSPETTLEIFTDPRSHPFNTLRMQYTKFTKRLELVTAGILEVTDKKRDRFMPVSFVHRSAREFFEDTAEGKKFLSADRLDKSQRLERLLRGSLVTAWYSWYERVSLFGIQGAISTRDMELLIQKFNDAFKDGLLDRKQLLNLVYHSQQAYDASRRLVGCHRQPIIWKMGQDVPGHIDDNNDFNVIFSKIRDKNLFVSCFGTDLGSQQSIEQISRDDNILSRRLPLVISQSYKAYLLHWMLRTETPKHHESVLWMLDQGVFENWPQGKEAAGLIQGLAGAAVLTLLRSYALDNVKWADFEILRLCLELDGAWDENPLFALEEVVPRSEGCTILSDLICGNLTLYGGKKTSYIVQAQATIPFLISAIIQTVSQPDDDKIMNIIRRLEDEVSRRCPDGLSPAKMLALRWEDYELGGGKLGDYGFVNISQESWSSLSLAQFNDLLKPGHPGPLQEAIQALDIETCERWDIEGINHAMLARVLA